MTGGLVDRGGPMPDCLSGGHGDCPDRWGDMIPGCGCDCHNSDEPFSDAPPEPEFVAVREVFLNGVLGYRPGAGVYAQVVRDFGLVVGVDVVANLGHSAVGGKGVARQQKGS